MQLKATLPLLALIVASALLPARARADDIVFDFGFNGQVGGFVEGTPLASYSASFLFEDFGGAQFVRSGWLADLTEPAGTHLISLSDSDTNAAASGSANLSQETANFDFSDSTTGQGMLFTVPTFQLYSGALQPLQGATVRFFTARPRRDQVPAGPRWRLAACLLAFTAPALHCGRLRPGGASTVRSTTTSVVGAIHRLPGVST